MRDWIAAKVEKTDVIFEGTVEALWGADGVEGEDDLVTFRVLRVYKGPSSEKIRVHSGIGRMWATSCGYDFRTGRTYVVFAQRPPRDLPWANEFSEDFLSTAICSLSETIERSDAVLHYLRGEPPQPEEVLPVAQYEEWSLEQKTGTLCGMVVRADKGRLGLPSLYLFDSKAKPQQFPSWALNLHDGDPSYRVKHVEPGRYRVSAVSEDENDGSRWVGLYGSGANLSSAPEIQVHTNSEQCGVSIVLYRQEVFTLRGTIRAVDGSELSFSNTNLNMASDDDTPYPVDRWGDTNSQGAFSFKGLPAGHYRLYIHIMNEGEPDWVAEDVRVQITADTVDFVVIVAREKENQAKANNAKPQ